MHKKHIVHKRFRTIRRLNRNKDVKCAKKRKLDSVVGGTPNDKLEI